VTDDRTLGQVLHAARIEHNPKTERPRNVPPWDQRAGWQRDLDEKMAAAVEAEVMERIVRAVQPEIDRLESVELHTPAVIMRKALQLALSAGGSEEDESNG
jgi:hypothetical protein